MMHVAYVCADPGVPVFGNKGCSIHVQEILRVLLQRGAKIDLFAYRVGGAPPADFQGMAVHELPVESGASVFRRERNLLYANKALGTLLSEYGPYDLIYERNALWAFGATAFARGNGIRSVLEINAPLVEEQSAHRELVDRHTAEVVSAKAICAATTVVAVSQQVAEYALQRGARASRVHVVPNGVRPERYSDQGTADKTPGRRLCIGFLGSLRPWHGVAELIEAFGHIDPVPGMPLPELCIVGDGPQRDALEEQASSLPAVRERIQFAGAVSYQEVPSRLASFDIAVAPYADAQHCYFSPLKVFEYMAAGLPIVAADAGQLREIIQDGENGLLYRPADIASMTSQLRRLLSDEMLRNALGSAARRDAECHHTWEQRVETILKHVFSRSNVSEPTPQAVPN